MPWARKAIETIFPPGPDLDFTVRTEDDRDDRAQNELMVKGMWGVVKAAERRARSAFRILISPARPVRHRSRNSERTSGTKKDHAWFVSFAPAYKPEIAVIALIENVGFRRQPCRTGGKRRLRSVFGETRRCSPAGRCSTDPNVSCKEIMVAIIEKRDLRDFDWLTSLLAIAIAASGSGRSTMRCRTESYWSKQIIGIGIALVAFLVVAFTDYRRIIDAAPFFYGFGLLLLALVLTPLGVEVNGQQAWLKLPVIGQFQPSEFVKIPTVLMLAKYFGARRRRRSSPLRKCLIGAAILAGPVGLIMLEPDAGQAITYFPILAAVLFLSAIKIRYVVIALVAAA